MARGDDKRYVEHLTEEANRYRAAAEAALDQLDWTIVHLHGIRKFEIARGLGKNLSTIRSQLDEA